MAEIKQAKPADALEDEDAVLDETLDEDAGTMSALSAVATEEPEPASDGNDLLNMFTEVGIETVDRSVLTSLAGDVDMVDLIAELNVVAAAMGIVRAQHEAASLAYQEESLAA